MRLEDLAGKAQLSSPLGDEARISVALGAPQPVVDVDAEGRCRGAAPPPGHQVQQQDRVHAPGAGHGEVVDPGGSELAESLRRLLRSRSVGRSCEDRSRGAHGRLGALSTEVPLLRSRPRCRGAIPRGWSGTAPGPGRPPRCPTCRITRPGCGRADLSPGMAIGITHPADRPSLDPGRPRFSRDERKEARMATRVGINGFGRIGRNVFRILENDPRLRGGGDQRPRPGRHAGLPAEVRLRPRPLPGQGRRRRRRAT